MTPAHTDAPQVKVDQARQLSPLLTAVPALLAAGTVDREDQSTFEPRLTSLLSLALGNVK